MDSSKFETKIITEVIGLNYYDFKDGKIRRDGVSFVGDKASAYRVESGSFVCETCGKVVNKDDDVLPVFWEGSIGNFVCIYDRGLFKKVPA